MSSSDTGPLLGVPEPTTRNSFKQEIFEIMKLAIPIFISSVSWIGMATIDTSLLGHTGTQYLSASSLSSLWTSATGVLLQGRVVGVFCGNAIGAGNKKLAGKWLQVAIVIALALTLPVMALWCITGPVLIALGEDRSLSSDAWYYAFVLAMCLPARGVFSSLSGYFGSQKITTPGAVASSVALVSNLVFGLIFVVGFPIPGWSGFGFYACPIVTASLEYVQLAILFFIYCLWKKIHEDCWPANGWSWENVTWTRVKEYLKLYVPAALSISSDFWRFGIIGAVAAKLGSIQVGVFTTSYRILWICLIFAGSIARAVGIKLSLALGNGNIVSAKYTIFVGSTVSFIICVVLACIVYFIPNELAKIFSNDPEVIDMFVSIRIPLALLVIFMVWSTFIEKVPRALGEMQKVFYINFIGSWAGQVPAVFLFTHFWKHDIVGLYYGMNVGYGMLNVFFILFILRIDWEKAVDDAFARAEKRRSSVKGTTLNNPIDDRAHIVITSDGES